MRGAARWFVVVVAVTHGLVHLLGVAKGFGWAEAAELEGPIGTAEGVVWLVAAVLVLATGLLFAARVRRWWAVGAIAVTVSQFVIVTSWSDAWAGTLANAVLLAGVTYGFAANGPAGVRTEYRRLVRAALEVPPSSELVTDDDLAGLPASVARYVRWSGAVGRPHVSNFRAHLHGRIRAAADSPWMTFVGEQVNTYGQQPARLFLIDASMSGLPVDVLHTFVGPRARMRVKLCSILTMLDVTGPELNQGETVTLLNDLCLFAPAALVDAPIEWDSIDDHRAVATFTHGLDTVRAELVFGDDGELVDFLSDDRFRSVDNGKRFVAQRWSTPVAEHRSFGPHRAIARGAGRWHAPAPEGDFVYLEIDVDAVTSNVTAGTAWADRAAMSSAKTEHVVITPDRHHE